jgi:hypothetical protein
MPVWFILLQLCWVAGCLCLGFKLWSLSAEMFENLKPGTRDWRLRFRRRAPSFEQLNESGQIIRRQFDRFLGITLAFFIGGGLLISFLKTIVAHRLS